MIEVTVVRETAAMSQTAIRAIITFFGSIIGVALAALVTGRRKRK